MTHALDLTYDTAPDLGLRPEDLVADDYGPCQAFGDRCRAEKGMPHLFTTPSAALPGTRNLVVLEERVPSPFSIEPIDEVDLPATLVGEDATAPTSVLGFVRYIGEPHPEYEAWRNGRAFEFMDPPLPSRA